MTQQRRVSLRTTALTLRCMLILLMNLTQMYRVLECAHPGEGDIDDGSRHNRPDHDQQHCYHQAPTVNQRLLLQLL